MLKSQLEKVFQSAKQAFESAKDSDELYQIKTQYMGTKGSFQKIIKQMKTLNPEERPIFGALLNEKKNILEKLYTQLRSHLKTQELERSYFRRKNGFNFTWAFCFLCWPAPYSTNDSKNSPHF